MKKYRTIILSIFVVAGAIFLAKYMVASNQPVELEEKKIIKTAFVETVENKNIPIIIKTNGNLVAEEKIEIFTEVQGVLERNRKPFDEGITFKKGEVILKINSDEHYATLQVQKSNLYNSITSIMPDIRLDYPDVYEKWQKYLENFDFDKTTPKLPEISSEKEKFFISGRNIYTANYTVKNMEVRLEKYTIRAPYNGILTEALVNEGDLVRPGQKLGKFIDPRNYELEVAINAKYIDLLQKGNSVQLHNLEGTKNWVGIVNRVNGRVDQTSQTVKAFIRVSSSDLKEGMYLEANLVAKSENDAYQIKRKMLVNNESVFVVHDSILELVKINPVYFKDKDVIVKGLENGTQILSKTIPGAYSGMTVKVFKDNNNL